MALTLCVLLVQTFSARAGGQVLYVDANAPAGGDGTGWSSAFRDLGFALFQAGPGGGDVSSIHVAQGEYKPDAVGGSIDATFVLVDGVTVEGGYAGVGEDNPDDRDITLYETILSGDLAGDDGPEFANNIDNVRHVVTGSGTDSSAVLDGLTVAGGNAVGVFPEGWGGGVLIDGGSPAIRNCVFRDNIADFGGAVGNIGGSPSLLNVTFVGNSARVNGGAIMSALQSVGTYRSCVFQSNSAGSGGAVYSSSGSDGLFRDCRFLENTALSNGGAVYNGTSHPMFSGCSFESNIASSSGGAMTNLASANPVVLNCLFTGNQAGQWGGAAYSFNDSNPTFYNCVFTGNNASNNGGALQNTQSSLTAVNCTFVGNTSGTNGGGIYLSAATATVTNTILWNNTPQEIFEVAGVPALVRYSNVLGGRSGAGNIDADPQFVPAENDYRLTSDSPCVDAGNSLAVEDRFSFDADCALRFVDHTGVSDTGVAAPGASVVDIGAYEFGTTPIQADRLHVNRLAPPAGDGASWATAHRSLQSALMNATACVDVTEMWVAGGQYAPGPPAASRDMTFRMINGLGIYGGFTGVETGRDERDAQANFTVLTGDMNGDDASGPGHATRAENAYHVVTAAGTDPSAVLDGFIIRSGNADGSFFLVRDSGGGVFVKSGAPTLANCRFIENASFSRGGGAFCANGSMALFEDCSFEGNRSSFEGGGAYVDDSAPIFSRCWFRGNDAASGGALFNGPFAATRLANCALTGNTAAFGAGVLNADADEPMFVNCTIAGNQADVDGGGVRSEMGSSPVFVNCVLWANDDGGATDQSAQISLDTDTVQLDYSCVQGLDGSLGGIGNIGEDPMFADALTGDYRLASRSPCIDSADNTAADSGMYDLLGLARFVDDPGMPDVGAGQAPIIDMGAFEFQGFTPAPGDGDADGDVDLDDFTLFAGCLGGPDIPAAPDCSIFDFDADNDVDIIDWRSLQSAIRN